MCWRTGNGTDKEGLGEQPRLSFGRFKRSVHIVQASISEAAVSLSEGKSSIGESKRAILLAQNIGLK
jgi:hypothetical protein